jgi:serine/threonine-protein kinase
MIGRTLSHYKILEKIGEGGMGEVYLAKDTKLDRDVAVKVLPATFSENKERLARFEREAKLLASLNHPNIAAIHELEESEGVHFLALEYVPGETLAERIKRGPIPVDEALPLFKQIAEGLEAAHEKGVIHRDLKPANIKVTPEGKVKVLDFGLAKAMASEPYSQDLSQSPTLTREGTELGVLLGTAAYMSPEQSRGKPVDKRTDIWAFGCCLYEVLTGRPAFLGETISDTISYILERKPDWSVLPFDTPPRIHELLRRCLQKDSERRFRDAWDVRVEIEEARDEPSSESVEKPSITGWRRMIPWCIAILATAFAIWSLTQQTPTDHRLPARSVIPTQPLGVSMWPMLALSPEGRRIVYVADRAGTSQLYVRNMDSFDSTPIPGTMGAASPFFSPDGQWVGFFADGKLKKVSLEGGTPQVLCAAPRPLGGTWGPDDSIIFAPMTNTGLRRISSSGGEPEILTILDSKNGESTHRWPHLLPDGKAVLFTVGTTGYFDESLIAVHSFATGERKVLVEGGMYPRYVPTGHLVYARTGSLLSLPFDPYQLKATDPPIQTLDGVRTDSLTGAAHYSISDDGLLTYVAGTAITGKRKLVWVDRKGASISVTEDLLAAYCPSLSPDGKSLALAIDEGARVNAWIYELEERRLTRLTFQGPRNRPLTWTSDGKRLTYASTRAGPLNLYWKAADGSGDEERLLVSEYNQYPCSWSPDGELLAFTEIHPHTGKDIWLLPLHGDKKARPFLCTPFNEGEAAFSPDGRWIAYTSDETGQGEVYVQPFPSTGGKWQISRDGGSEPVWATSGKELFYRNGNKMMAVMIVTVPAFTADQPRTLFEGHYYSLDPGWPQYAVSLDGQRFMMIKEEEDVLPSQLHVVLNWHEELKRLVPTN